jgi:hypothetical protein
MFVDISSRKVVTQFVWGEKLVEGNRIVGLKSL